MPDEMMTDELDGLLDASGPVTTNLTEAGQVELERLVSAARDAQVVRSRRRRRRAAGVAVAGLVVGAGSMVAAASSLELEWVPWIGDADRSESFATPRGQSCDAVFRLIHDEALLAANPQAHAELIAFLADFEPTPDAIAAEARYMADAEVLLEEEDGGQRVTTGGALFNADDLERMARERVIGNAVNDKAAELGIEGRADLEGESECDE